MEYVLVECKCGIPYKEENYEFYELKMTSDLSEFKLPTKKVRRCRICKQVLISKLIENNQPERSKREDSQKCEMRCSEHCGNTVREAQETSSPIEK